MTREIKFRFWDKIEKKMGTPKTMNWNEQGTLRTFGGDLVYMQYTGLKDRNGKEIFDGDICNSHNGVLMGAVIYQAPSFIIKKNKRAKSWFTFDLAETQHQFQEVIGNIYENPELLESTNKEKI